MLTLERHWPASCRTCDMNEDLNTRRRRVLARLLRATRRLERGLHVSEQEVATLTDEAHEVLFDPESRWQPPSDGVAH